MNYLKALISALIVSIISALFHRSTETVFLAFMLTFYAILILDKLIDKKEK